MTPFRTPAQHPGENTDMPRLMAAAASLTRVRKRTTRLPSLKPYSGFLDIR